MYLMRTHETGKSACSHNYKISIIENDDDKEKEEKTIYYNETLTINFLFSVCVCFVLHFYT